ncbi:15-hydroxyprostaglandin dehydrogenase [NAD(+)]-like [Amphiura filiformis]|uniref:15-hydroxyprostaglandin dehydrogenase [NAD(+)]-like n=1 Tax=Amphiura filiformis TaxID=82378 RepID=UPI003B20BBC8
MDVRGKVGIITGGAFGIGKKLVETLLQKGAKGVVILDVNESNGRTTQAEFEKRFGKGRVVFRKCDVSSMAQMQAAFQFTIDTYGKLNIVCNNAGFWDELNWEKMFLVNINGVVNGTKAATEFMKGEADGGGVIVNIASIAALLLMPLSPLYATSKYAVLGYSRNVAHFDRNVIRKKLRVNILCPSAVKETNLLPGAKAAVGEQKLLDDYLAAIPSTTTDAVAKAFLKVIEEPYNGASFYIPSYRRQKGEVAPVFIEDETARFRKQLGVEKSMLEVVKSSL